MDKQPEYSKFVRVYMPYKEEDPYPLRFYAGVSPKDIDFMITECVNDLKVHSNNDKLKLWNRPDGTEVANKNTILNKLNSLVIAERQPRLASRPMQCTFANKNAMLGIPSTANVSPVESQDPIEDISSFSIAKEDLEKERSREREKEKEKEKEKERERERERLQEGLSTKKLKGMMQPRKKSSGPIVEKVTPTSPTSTKKDSNKIRTRSVAKSFIINNRSQQLPTTKPPVNEMSFLPRSDSSKVLVISHERIDTSLTFNPIKNAVGIDKGSYSMASVPKSRRDQYLNSQQHVLLNESVSNQDETASKNEENSFARFDKNSKKLLLQVQGDPTPRSRRKVSNLYQTGDVAVKPIDGKDPHIYSFQKGIAPFSYLTGTMENKFIEKLPPPLYFPSHTILDRKPLKKSEILKDLEILPSGDLKLTDPEILKQQKGIIEEISKKLSKSVSDGRGIMGVSLPIKVFEPRSLLERTCDWWTFVPNYLIPAARSSNSIQRMKKVIGAAIGGLYVSAQQLKPFSPLLGETYQASFPQHGISINLESTSHSPNIANFLLNHKDFKLWGKYEYITKLEGSSKNSMVIHHQGPNHVDFNDGQRISFTWPQIQISGLTTGDRTCKYIGSMQFVDEMNKIKTVIKFGDTGNDKSLPKKRNDIFTGKVYFYNSADTPGKKKSDKNDSNYKDMKEEICSLHGSWLEYLQIEQDEVWNINKETPTQYVPVENPLPSDVRFREDILWLKRNNKLHAQEWKLILEERQRYERKLRMQQSKTKSKKK